MSTSQAHLYEENNSSSRSPWIVSGFGAFQDQLPLLEREREGVYCLQV